MCDKVLKTHWNIFCNAWSCIFTNNYIIVNNLNNTNDIYN
jgi:hypothetical protein